MVLTSFCLSFKSLLQFWKKLVGESHVSNHQKNLEAAVLYTILNHISRGVLLCCVVFHASLRTICPRCVHLSRQSSVVSPANADSRLSPVLKCRSFCVGPRLWAVAVQGSPHCIDCIDHVVQFVPGCFLLWKDQSLPEGVARSKMNRKVEFWKNPPLFNFSEIKQRGKLMFFPPTKGPQFILLFSVSSLLNVRSLSCQSITQTLFIYHFSYN